MTGSRRKSVKTGPYSKLWIYSYLLWICSCTSKGQPSFNTEINRYLCLFVYPLTYLLSQVHYYYYYFQKIAAFNTTFSLTKLSAGPYNQPVSHIWPRSSAHGRLFFARSSRFCVEHVQLLRLGHYWHHDTHTN